MSSSHTIVNREFRIIKRYHIVIDEVIFTYAPFLAINPGTWIKPDPLRNPKNLRDGERYLFAESEGTYVFNLTDIRDIQSKSDSDFSGQEISFDLFTYSDRFDGEKNSPLIDLIIDTCWHKKGSFAISLSTLNYTIGRWQRITHRASEKGDFSFLQHHCREMVSVRFNLAPNTFVAIKQFEVKYSLVGGGGITKKFEDLSSFNEMFKFTTGVMKFSRRAIATLIADPSDYYIATADDKPFQIEFSNLQPETDFIIDVDYLITNQSDLSLISDDHENSQFSLKPTISGDLNQTVVWFKSRVHLRDLIANKDVDHALVQLIPNFKDYATGEETIAVKLSHVEVVAIYEPLDQNMLINTAKAGNNFWRQIPLMGSRDSNTIAVKSDADVESINYVISDWLRVNDFDNKLDLVITDCTNNCTDVTLTVFAIDSEFEEISCHQVKLHVNEKLSVNIDEGKEGRLQHFILKFESNVAYEATIAELGYADGCFESSCIHGQCIQNGNI